MPQATTHDQYRLVPARQVCAMLGVSNMTLYRLYTSGKMPEPKKINKRKFWRLSDVQDWIDAR